MTVYKSVKQSDSDFYKVVRVEDDTEYDVYPYSFYKWLTKGLATFRANKLMKIEGCLKSLTEK